MTMIYLHKILPYLIYPISIILILLVWSLVSKKRLPITIALAILIFTSSPIISNQLASYLEKDYPRKTIEQIDNADAIVVLSGILSIIETPSGLFYEWGDADRFFAGLDLISAEKASAIIFTGGISIWQKNSESEGFLLAKVARQFGISNSQIIVTKNVFNTKEEAQAVREILNQKGINKIVLVTSAFHMARASQLFAREGIEIEAYPVDYKSKDGPITLIDFLPSAQALALFQQSLNEMIGRIYYALQ